MNIYSLYDERGMVDAKTDMSTKGWIHPEYNIF